MPELQLLGVITEDEKNQIMQIYMRKSALMELSLTLAQRGGAEQNGMYERIVADMADATRRMQEWWSGVSRRYNWVTPLHATWHVDFTTREVKLTVPDPQPVGHS